MNLTKKIPIFFNKAGPIYKACGALSHFTSDGRIARPASVILPSAIIFRARSLFFSVQFDLGRRGVKRVT